MKWCYGKYWKWPLAMFGLHSIFIIWVAMEVANNYSGPGYQEETQIWNICMFVDFPFSLLASWIWELFGNVVSVRHWNVADGFYYIVLPAILFGLCGGIQYFIIGWFLSKRIRK